MFRGVAVVSLALLAGCADLVNVPVGVCGNGVVEPGEDCEPAGSASCGSSGSRACRLICGARTPCPDGWGCGADGLCRHGTDAYSPLDPVADSADQRLLGDFDGDGNPDVLSIRSGAVRVRYGDGTGSFGPPVERSARVPVTTGAADASDIDGDGRTDLVMPTPEGPEVLHGTASRQLVPESFASERVGDASLIRADYLLHGAPAEEGVLSVLVLGPAGPPWALISRIGQKSGGAGVSGLPGLDLTHLPPRAVAADLDGDGKDEVALVAAPKTVDVLHLEPDLVTSSWVGRVTPVILPKPVAGAGRDMFADVTGDGALDLVIEGAAGEVFVAPGDGKGGLLLAARSAALESLGSFPLALGDIDGDGAVDAVTRDGIYVGRGSAFTVAYSPPGGQHLGEALLADIDGDGVRDVATTYEDQPGVDILLSSCVAPGCQALLFRRLHVPTAGPARLLRAADFDGRGRIDLVFAVADGAQDEIEIVHGEDLEEPVTAQVGARLPRLIDMQEGFGGTDADHTHDGFPDLFATGEASGMRFVSTIFGGGFLSAPYALEYEAVPETPVAAAALPGGTLAVLTTEAPGASRFYVLKPGTIATERSSYPLTAEPLSRFGSGCALLRTSGEQVALVTRDVPGCRPDLAITSTTAGRFAPLDVSVLAGQAPARDAVLIGQDLLLASRDGISLSGHGAVAMDASSVTITRADADPGVELAAAAGGQVRLLSLAGQRLQERPLAAPAPAGTWIASADVDRDGVPDLVTGDGDSFRVLLAVPSFPRGAIQEQGAGGAGGGGGAGGDETGGSGGTGACLPADGNLGPELQSVEQLIRTTLAQDPGEPGIAVEVVKDGEVIASGAFGFAAPCRPMTTSTRTLVVEGAELVTVAAYFDMEKQGLVGDGKHIADALPELELEGGTSPETITMAMLLQHAAGLPAAPADVACAGLDALSLEEMASTWHPQLWATPGSFYIYSTRGLALLGLAMQRADGSTFAELAKRRVLDPAGMTAVFDPIRARVEGVAEPYDSRYPIDNCPAYEPTALFASTEDMGKLLVWLFQKGPLVGDLPRLEDSGGPSFLPHDKAGYGDLLWYAHQHNGDKPFWIGWVAGASGGYASAVAYAPARNLGVVALSNGTSPVVRDIVSGVLDAMLETNDRTTIVTGKRADYVGTFVDQLGVGWGPRTFTVSIVGSDLWMSAGGIDAQMTPIDTDVFSLTLYNDPVNVRFWRDPNNQVFAFTALDGLGPPAYRVP